MENNAPVNVAKAQAAGGGDAEERMGDDAAASAKELLMCLPGVNVHNYRNVRWGEGGGGGLAVHNYRNVGLGGVGEGVCAWMFRPKFLRLLMQVFCKWGTAGEVGAHMPSRGERPQSVGWW